MIIFGKKIARREKLWGSIGKLEHRCTTTNLPLCNDAIIVSKIVLLHSVSVFTIFVISKRDKKTDRDKKNHTFLSTAGTRPRIPTILGMVIEEVCPVLAPPPSFAAKGYLKFVGKCHHRGKMLITWVFVPRK